MKNVREQETNKGIKEFVELYNNYGAKIWAKRKVIYEFDEDDDELDREDIEEQVELVVNRLVDIISSTYTKKKVKKFRARGEGEEYQSYLIAKSKYLNTV